MKTGISIVTLIILALLGIVLVDSLNSRYLVPVKNKALLGQTKDKRAELDIQGGVSEFSVSPDGKIWLVTTMGNTYYTNNIDSTWHFGKPLSDSSDKRSVDASGLERISFFNKDTAIMTGYILANNNENRKNGYYLTNDAGKTWELRDYGGDSWIYSICINKEGNAWMGGLAKELYYSYDFGNRWITKEMPYLFSERTYGIYMSNPRCGVAGSDDNEILTTEDNWATVSHLKTPLDQKKYRTDESQGYVDNRISKVLIWGQYIVVNQNGYIFYSDKSKIDWKSFPIGVVDFEVDNDSKVLFAVSDSLKVLSFSTPNRYQTLSNEKLAHDPVDMKVSNGSLYVFTYGYNVYKVNKDRLMKSSQYTTDTKIPEPELVKKGTNLMWGANGNHLYLSEYNNPSWYREKVLDFDVSDFKLLSDSVAIFWDGTRNNYLYSLKKHDATIYFQETPLKHFLASPAKTFTIKSGSHGCFHHMANVVSYEKANDSTFVASKLTVYQNRDSNALVFKNNVVSSRLSKTLSAIDLNPYAIPSLKDFRITEKDKGNYLAMVGQRLKKKNEGSLNGKKKINKAFYDAVPLMLDTLGNGIVSAILNQQEVVGSTTSYWFKIQMVNENNDTLNVSRNYYKNTLPWNLPWLFECNGQYFNCYSIDFSRFVNSCIPDNFNDKGVFDNSILIMEIADYLWNKEE